MADAVKSVTGGVAPTPSTTPQPPKPIQAPGSVTTGGAQATTPQVPPVVVTKPPMVQPLASVATPAKAPDAEALPKDPTAPAVILKKVDPESKVKVEPSISERITKFCESLVKIEPQGPGSKYSHRGVCVKCGWQSFQYTEVDAHDVVFNHAAKHWSEVAHG